MDDVELIEKASAAMRRDSDPRWRAVSELLIGSPLGYARMLANHPERERLALNYPDAARAVAVAREYLGEG